MHAEAPHGSRSVRSALCAPRPARHNCPNTDAITRHSGRTTSWARSSRPKPWTRTPPCGGRPTARSLLTARPAGHSQRRRSQGQCSCCPPSPPPPPPPPPPTHSHFDGVLSFKRAVQRSDMSCAQRLALGMTSDDVITVPPNGQAGCSLAARGRATGRRPRKTTGHLLW